MLRPEFDPSGYYISCADTERQFDVGSVSDATARIYPQVRSEVLFGVEDFCDDIQLYCDEVWHQGAKLFLRGSTGKRLVYETFTGLTKPPGWDTPKKIWTDLAAYFPPTNSLFDPVKLFTERLPEADMAFEPLDGDSFAHIKAEARKHFGHTSGMTIHAFTYAGIDILNIVWPDSEFTLQLHSLPNERNWDMESRTSFNIPFSESGSGAFIKGRRVTVGEFELNGICSEKGFYSVYHARLEQQIVGLQRMKMNHFWYRQDGKILKEFAGGQNMVGFLGTPDYWPLFHANSLNDPQKFYDRQPEMACNNLFLLTACPDVLGYNDYRMVFLHTPLYKIIEKNTYKPPNDYLERFRNGTLTAGESGPVIIAKYYGLQHPGELLPLVTPQLV